MDGLVPCVFFKVFTCWWNLMTRLASKAILHSLANSVYITTYDWLRGLLLHCDAWRHKICWVLLWTCIVTSRSGRQPSKHGVFVDRSRVICHVYGRIYDTKTQYKRDKSMSIPTGRSRDSRQVRFFLNNSLYFFIKFGSSKLQIYRLNSSIIERLRTLVTNHCPTTSFTKLFMLGNTLQRYIAVVKWWCTHDDTRFFMVCSFRTTGPG